MRKYIIIFFIIFIFVCVSGCSFSPKNFKSDDPIRIDLCGFNEDDLVTVTINGRMVYCGHSYTVPSLGWSTRLYYYTQADILDIHVAVGTDMDDAHTKDGRVLSKDYKIKIVKGKNIAIAIEYGKLIFHQSREAFSYF